VSIYDSPVKTLQNEPASLEDHRGETLLIVNVASRCGKTPQYTQLEELQQRFGGRGFTVLGFPCNQFGGQEPGTPEEIATFCAVNYGISFPIFEKIDVNGPDRHPLYRELTAVPDGDGYAGDIRWNFEKFLVSPQGEVVARFSPKTAPDAPGVVSAIEAQLSR
jgi:glutathione peroxidase